MFDFFSGAGAPTQLQGGLMGLYRQQMPSGLSSYGFSSPMDSSMFMQRALGPTQQSAAMQPQGYREGGSVSRQELDALPGYQAGGIATFSPLARVLPSERRFMDERMGEYEAYNRQVEPYNQAYDKYVADVEAYNRAAEAYNAGPRTADFTMTEPTFTAQAPVMPDFTPEQYQQYQQQAQRRAGQRALALSNAFYLGIAPEIAQYFRRGIV